MTTGGSVRVISRHRTLAHMAARRRRTQHPIIAVWASLLVLGGALMVGGMAAAWVH